jgi:hypothetical protein
MIDVNTIKEHAQVIGADGVHVGIVDHVDGNRIELTRQASVDDKHHYIATSLVAEVEDGVVRLSANADVAIGFEEDAD